LATASFNPASVLANVIVKGAFCFKQFGSGLH
jgi:hypothetical protein